MSTYNKNGATVTITTSSSWTSSDSTLNNAQISSGFDTSLSTVSFAGKVKLGRPVVISTIKITADTDKYFTSPPRLEGNSRGVSLRLRDKINKKLSFSDGVFYTSYTYDLVFIAKGQSTPLNIKSGTIKYTTKDIPSYTDANGNKVIGVEPKIYDIQFGSRQLSSSGESRVIKVFGTRGTKFGLAINENLRNEVTFNNEVVSQYNKSDDVSIIRSPRGDSVIYNYGKDMLIKRGTISNSGVYTFNQEFPSTTVLRSTVAAAASSTTDVVFTSIDGIRKGDRMYYRGLADTTVITVSVLEPGGVANKLTLSSTVSLAKGYPVTFKRGKVYSIDIIPELTSTLGPKIPTVDPEYRLYQYLDPTLTITHSTDQNDLTITHNNGVETGLDRDENHVISYTGKANKRYKNLSDRTTNRFKVSLIVTAHSTNFSSFVKPVFSNRIRKKYDKKADGSANNNIVISNWTNSIAEFNGGTVLNITGIKTGATGSGTTTLDYTVEILQWGNKDVAMELDLDTHLINT